jgi:hypothetical protein
MSCSSASLKRGEIDLQFFNRRRTYRGRRPPAVPETTWLAKAGQWFIGNGWTQTFVRGIGVDMIQLPRLTYRVAQHMSRSPLRMPCLGSHLCCIWLWSEQPRQEVSQLRPINVARIDHDNGWMPRWLPQFHRVSSRNHVVARCDGKCRRRRSKEEMDTCFLWARDRIITWETLLD